MTKIDELLTVLDMPEEKWLRAIATFAYHSRKDSEILADFHREYKCGYMETSLADLAFRLRDEVIQTLGKDYWRDAWEEIWIKIKGLTRENYMWGFYKAQPIHWIIAALIAKELAKSKCKTCGGGGTVVNPIFGPDDPSQPPYLQCSDCSQRN